MLYLTLRQYSYLVAVAEAGSLTLAAARLNVSQPSLSVAITRVEDRLGQTLFERGKGAPIVLTPFGHRFVTRARRLLADAADLEQAAHQIRPLVVGCFEDIAPWYLAHLLEVLTTHLPDLTFQGREARFARIAADLAEGRMDLAVSYDLGFGAQVQRRVLGTVAPVAFVAPDHPLARQPNATLAQLAEHPLILFDEPLSESFMRDLFTGQNLTPDVAHKTASLEMMRALAAHRQGVGLSYSNPPTATSYDGAPLVSVPISDPQARTDIALLWSSRGTPDPALARVLDVLNTPSIFGGQPMALPVREPHEGHRLALPPG